MPPPTPPPECSGHDEGGTVIAGDAAGASPPVRLRLRDATPTASAAVGHVYGRYRVAGVLQAYLDADYARAYPSELVQSVTITVRFARARLAMRNPSVGGVGAFVRTLTASMVRPAFTHLGWLPFEQSDVPLEPGETITMQLLDARWSLSPQRGRERVYTVHADVSNYLHTPVHTQSFNPRHLSALTLKLRTYNPATNTYVDYPTNSPKVGLWFKLVTDDC
jgi:hypothetical protein